MNGEAIVSALEASIHMPPPVKAAMGATRLSAAQLLLSTCGSVRQLKDRLTAVKARSGATSAQPSQAMLSGEGRVDPHRLPSGLRPTENLFCRRLMNSNAGARTQLPWKNLAQDTQVGKLDILFGMGLL